MKKTMMLLVVLSIMTIVSCKKKEETIPPPPPPTIETPAPPAEPGSEDGTSIKVSTDGLDVSTKDGATKTDVNVSNGDASVEIKK